MFNDKPTRRAASVMPERDLSFQRGPVVHGAEVAPAEICRCEPVLVDVQSLLTQGGIEGLEQSLVPTLHARAQHLHMLQFDFERLDALVQGPPSAQRDRALDVRRIAQGWVEGGILVMVRHAPLTQEQKTSALTRFFKTYARSSCGAYIVQSLELAQSVCDAFADDGDVPAPRMFYASRESLRDMTPRLRPCSNKSLPLHGRSVVLSSETDDAQNLTKSAAEAPQSTPKRQKRAERDFESDVLRSLVNDGYVFIPDTSSLMFNPQQCSRRFFENGLAPLLLKRTEEKLQRNSVWLLDSVRQELTRHIQKGNPTQQVDAADGLRTVTGLEMANLLTAPPPYRPAFGQRSSYADAAFEQVMIEHAAVNRLCVVTQDRGLAARLSVRARQDTRLQFRAVRLRAESQNPLESWDGLLKPEDLDAARKEIDIDMRVEAQFCAEPVAQKSGESIRAQETGAKTADRTVGQKSAGVLKSWKSDGGYGFVQPDDGSRPTFLHIEQLDGAMGREPQAGERIRFTFGMDKQQRWRAVQASYESAPHDRLEPVAPSAVSQQVGRATGDGVNSAEYRAIVERRLRRTRWVRGGLMLSALAVAGLAIGGIGAPITYAAVAMFFVAGMMVDFSAFNEREYYSVPGSKDARGQHRCIHCGHRGIYKHGKYKSNTKFSDCSKCRKNLWIE